MSQNKYSGMVCLILCLCTVGFSQNKRIAVLKDSLSLEAKNVFGADAFGTLYYTSEDHTLYKKTKEETISYANFQLGEITTVDTFNPLKMTLFYKDFNTVIILDNRLAELFKIDFNALQPYKNVTFVSSGFDNTIWVFNSDLQQLERYDYKTHSVRTKTLPIQSPVLDQKSDYNYCYLLTEDALHIYNYFGSLVSKYKNEGYQKMAFGQGRLLLLKDNDVFILSEDENDIQPIQHTKILITDFFATNETLYIYHHNKLRLYHLKSQ